MANVLPHVEILGHASTCSVRLSASSSTVMRRM
jgi:hypothetical protein